jgi:hypothetical protein
VAGRCGPLCNDGNDGWHTSGWLHPGEPRCEGGPAHASVAAASGRMGGWKDLAQTPHNHLSVAHPTPSFLLLGEGWPPPPAPVGQLSLLDHPFSPILPHSPHSPLFSSLGWLVECISHQPKVLASIVLPSRHSLGCMARTMMPAPPSRPCGAVSGCVECSWRPPLDCVDVQLERCRTTSDSIGRRLRITILSHPPACSLLSHLLCQPEALETRDTLLLTTMGDDPMSVDLTPSQVQSALSPPLLGLTSLLRMPQKDILAAWLAPDELQYFQRLSPVSEPPSSGPGVF